MFFSAVDLWAAWLSHAFIFTLCVVYQMKRVTINFQLTYCRHLVTCNFSECLLDNNLHSVCFLILTHKQKLTLKVSRNDIDFWGDDCPGFTFCQKVFARPREREVVNCMKFEICIYCFSPFSIFQFILAYLIILTKFENFLQTNICSLPFETI